MFKSRYGIMLKKVYPCRYWNACNKIVLHSCDEKSTKHFFLTKHGIHELEMYKNFIGYLPYLNNTSQIYVLLLIF